MGGKEFTSLEELYHPLSILCINDISLLYKKDTGVLEGELNAFIKKSQEKNESKDQERKMGNCN